MGRSWAGNVGSFRSKWHAAHGDDRNTDSAPLPQRYAEGLPRRRWHLALSEAPLLALQGRPPSNPSYTAHTGKRWGD